MRFGSITSGSSGNCLFVGDDSNSFLIDAGISGKKIAEGLKSFDLVPEDLDGIFVTHEHSDHVRGLGIMARRYDIPIYATKGTIRELKNMQCLGKISEDLFHEVHPGEILTIGSMDISAISTSHDAADPCAYKFTSGKKSFAQVTDTGIYTDDMINMLKGTDVMLVESNHDLRMLQAGRYPYYLKRRIMGEKGHLSNEDAGRLLSVILGDNVKHVFLGHLSHENNYEDLAFETVRQEINLSNCPYKADDFHISIAHRDRISNLIDF